MDASIFKNCIWRFFERFGAQGVTFIVSIVLARILDPDVYGVIAIVNVLITFTSIFIDSGLSTALIQKKDADDLDFSTVFIFNLFSSVVLYIIVFFCAPLVATYYDMPILVDIIRVLGLTLIIAGIKNTQIAYVSKHMMFKKFFFSTLIGTIGAGIVGVVLAIDGYGVWALVWQHLFNTVVDTIVLFLTVNWKPKCRFSFTRLKILWSFGWKILLNAMLSNVYYESRQLFIGKLYTAKQLAYFNKGGSFPNTILSIVNSSIFSVIFPAMSNEQDDILRVKEIAKKVITISSFLLVPSLMGLAGCANKLVDLVLTEKWLPAVKYLRIYCFTYIFYPVKSANISAFNALGRSDSTLIRSIINDIICIIALLATIKKSLFSVGVAMLVTMIVSLFVDSYKSGVLFDYSLKNQMSDVMFTYIGAFIMGANVYFIGIVIQNNIIALFVQIFAGISIYIGIEYLFKNPALFDLLQIVRKSSAAKDEVNGNA